MKLLVCYTVLMTLMVTGGNTQSDVPLPSPQTLQEVSVPIVSYSQCSNSYSSLTSNRICAHLTNGGKDSSQGDSGGPMVNTDGSKWVQAGVVSFGNDCVQPRFPGIYTRVSKYQSWINGFITSDQPGFVNFQSSSSNVSSTGTAPFMSFSVPLLLSILPVLFSLFVLS